MICVVKHHYIKKRIGKRGIQYSFNPETGIINIDLKLERVKNDGCFVWEDMIVLNQVIGMKFIGMDQTIKNIVNKGSGVGTFENENDERFPMCILWHRRWIKIYRMGGSK